MKWRPGTSHLYLRSIGTARCSPPPQSSSPMPSFFPLSFVWWKSSPESEAGDRFLQIQNDCSVQKDEPQTLKAENGPQLISSKGAELLCGCDCIALNAIDQACCETWAKNWHDRSDQENACQKLTRCSKSPDSVVFYFAFWRRFRLSTRHAVRPPQHMHIFIEAIANLPALLARGIILVVVRRGYTFRNLT